MGATHSTGIERLFRSGDLECYYSQLVVLRFPRVTVKFCPGVTFLGAIAAIAFFDRVGTPSKLKTLIFTIGFANSRSGLIRRQVLAVLAVCRRGTGIGIVGIVGIGI